MRMRHFAPILVLLAACASTAPPTRTHVRIDAAEADAVLAVLDARAEGRSIAESEWQRVFTTEGYVRLQKRERSMQRPFEDDAFRAFVMSPELLAKRDIFKAALSRINRANLSSAASRALAYLPRGAVITATIYPVIKPRENSFVFEGNAIFKYIEDEPLARFEETVAHELHHIGYATACPPSGMKTLQLPPPKAAMQKWLSAFGEGFAVLAAAGGPHGDPYLNATPDVRAAWLQGLSAYGANFQQVASFFDDVIAERLTGDAIDKRAFEFFGLVGPWYTVGWKMALTVEEELGRDALIGAFCDQRTLLATYNRAAAAHENRTGEKLPRWGERLAGALAAP
jgi:hypothetical protein